MTRRALAYRMLVTFSGVTFLVAGLLLRAPIIVWGPLGQAVSIVAGLSLLVAAWTSWTWADRTAAYSAGIAGLLLTTTAYLLDYPEKWSAVVVWFSLTAYTVALVAFGWVKEPPE